MRSSVRYSLEGLIAVGIIWISLQVPRPAAVDSDLLWAAIRTLIASALWIAIGVLVFERCRIEVEWRWGGSGAPVQGEVLEIESQRPEDLHLFYLVVSYNMTGPLSWLIRPTVERTTASLTIAFDQPSEIYLNQDISGGAVEVNPTSVVVPLELQAVQGDLCWPRIVATFGHKPGGMRLNVLHNLECSPAWARFLFRVVAPIIALRYTSATAGP